MSVFNVGVAMFSSNTTILALDGAELAVNGSETKSVAVVEAALNPVAVPPSLLFSPNTVKLL